ncbi:MAG: sodium:proton symporter [Pseudomonadota bacterium]
MIRQIAAGLDWLGRQGTGAVAASLFAGMALPGLAEAFRPLLQVAVFLLLVTTLMRLDFGAVRAWLGRWPILIWALAWAMLIMPLLVGGGLRVSGLTEAHPDLALAVFIATVPPPVMSVAALAAVLRLDHTLSVMMLVLSAAVTPVVAPFIAGFTLDAALPLDPFALAGRLLVFLGGAFGVALLVRRFVGLPAIQRRGNRLDGITVVILFVFAVAAMDGVAEAFLTRTGFAFALLATVFVLAIVQIGITRVVLAGAGERGAMTIALGTGIRNMALFVAAIGSAMPETTWLFFGIGQFPIYLLPHMLKFLRSS